MITSYHVHSNLSDGETEMEQMILAAIGAELDEVGISDHYLLLPNEETLYWSIKPDQLPSYVDRALELKEKYKDNITVRLGIEVDFMPDTIEVVRERLSLYPFDYKIGSIHICNGFSIDNTAQDWEEVDQDKRNEVIIDYWKHIKMMAESGVFDIAGHLDIHKKFGYKATLDYSSFVGEALDAIAKAKMSVELNTSGWNRPVKEQYPSEAILNGCKERNIPIIITADAHDPHHINRDYDKAQALLDTLGIKAGASYCCGELITNN